MKLNIFAVIAFSMATAGSCFGQALTGYGTDYVVHNIQYDVTALGITASGSLPDTSSTGSDFVQNIQTDDIFTSPGSSTADFFAFEGKASLRILGRSPGSLSVKTISFSRTTGDIEGGGKSDHSGVNCSFDLIVYNPVQLRVRVNGTCDSVGDVIGGISFVQAASLSSGVVGVAGFTDSAFQIANGSLPGGLNEDDYDLFTSDGSHEKTETCWRWTNNPLQGEKKVWIYMNDLSDSLPGYYVPGFNPHLTLSNANIIELQPGTYAVQCDTAASMFLNGGTTSPDQASGFALGDYLLDLDFYPPGSTAP